MRPVQVAAQTSTPDSNARSLVHILDYIARDYSGAVSNGEIANQLEYEEILQFSETALSLTEQLISHGSIPTDADLLRAISGVREGVRQRLDPEVVASDATRIRRMVVRLTGLRLTPTRWPNLESGKRLFSEYCASCHGLSGAGNGPAASTLSPRPTDFVRGERISSVAPYQAYNTIRLGLDGTAMASFEQLSDRDVWNLAFFVKSLKTTYRDIDESGPVLSIARLQKEVSLENLAILNDSELELVLDEAGIVPPKNGVAILRTRSPEEDSGSPLDAADLHLNAALSSYISEHYAAALQEAVSAYLEGIEPIEFNLAASDPELSARLETQMMGVRSAIGKRVSNEEVTVIIRQAQVSITKARAVMQDQSRSAWFVFTMATSILLREGLEAFLIILAMLGILRTSGQNRAAAWIHGGWILAILVGLAFWFLTDLLIQFGASQRELMEGVISLVAVAVLLYVGFWLHNKSSTQKWSLFIGDRINRQINHGNLLGLSAIAFFAVFREAFESVLFLSALGVEDGSHTGLALAGAALTSISVVLVLGFLVLRFSVRIPTQKLFIYLSLLVGILAVVLAGKGVHALQEAGHLSVTPLPSVFRLDLIGLYPTAESTIAQVLILGMAALLHFLPLRRRHPGR